MVTLTKPLARPTRKVRSTRVPRTVALGSSLLPVLSVRVLQNRRTTETESEAQAIPSEYSGGLAGPESAARVIQAGSSRGTGLPSSSIVVSRPTPSTREERPLFSIPATSSMSVTSPALLLPSVADTSTVDSSPRAQPLGLESLSKKKRQASPSTDHHGVVKRCKLDNEENVAPVRRAASSSGDISRVPSSSKGLQRSLSYPGDISHFKPSSKYPGPYL